MEQGVLKNPFGKTFHFDWALEAFSGQEPDRMDSVVVAGTE